MEVPLPICYWCGHRLPLSTQELSLESCSYCPNCSKLVDHAHVARGSLQEAVELQK